MRPSLLEHDCCEHDLTRLAVEAAGCDGVIAVGGGKVLDAGKLLAHRLGLACITVPTSAATCAGWTALANLYSPEGAFEADVALERCPELLVFDHDLVRQAPARTLASGVADAMAKWYEASVSSGASDDGLVQQAVQMARVLRDQLLLEAREAFADPHGPAWVRVAEGCALTAGVIGGIGGARCRTVAARISSRSRSAWGSAPKAPQARSSSRLPSAWPASAPGGCSEAATARLTATSSKRNSPARKSRAIWRLAMRQTETLVRGD
jgi:glycerol dehydrogenase